MVDGTLVLNSNEVAEILQANLNEIESSDSDAVTTLVANPDGTFSLDTALTQADIVAAVQNGVVEMFANAGLTIGTFAFVDIDANGNFNFSF